MGIREIEFLNLAKDLNDSSSAKETEFRTSASRAYYSAYHAALAISRECLSPGDVRGGMHERLIRTLAQGNASVFKEVNSKVISLSYSLRDLKSYRVRSDYRLDDDFKKDDSDYCIVAAEQIINRVREVESYLSSAAAAN